jgi:ABC-type Zn uptake system ZnuABC Zn-binding protein ZnuA
MTLTRTPRWFALALFPAAALFAGCTAESDPWPADKAGPKVLVSFAPLYSFAVNVAGDDAVVKSVMSSQGPHGFEPTAQHAKLLTKADLFLLNGLELDEKIAGRMKKGSGNKNLKVVALGDKLNKELLKASECNHDHGDHKHAHDHAHDHGEFDPHVWLGHDTAVRMVEGIRDELQAIDPAHASGYDQRAAAYIAKLTALRDDGLKRLADKKERTILTFHESLGYFAGTYKLEIAGAIEVSPGAEPTAQKLSEIVETCLKKNVRLIAVEPQFPSNTSAKAVLQELQRKGVKDVAFVEIDPLETAAENELSAEWYETKMRQNLENLAKALK